MKTDEMSFVTVLIVGELHAKHETCGFFAKETALEWHSHHRLTGREKYPRRGHAAHLCFVENGRSKV